MASDTTSQSSSEQIPPPRLCVRFLGPAQCHVLRDIRFALLVLFVAIPHRSTMSDFDPRLLRICASYTRTVLKKEVDGILALYHPTARVFDTWGVWSYEGEPARRKAIEQWFGSLGEERVAVTFDRVQATVTSDLASLTSRVVYAAISPAGAELRSMQNRLTWVLKPDGDEWKIIHEHTSVPLGPDLKGLLAREA